MKLAFAAMILVLAGSGVAGAQDSAMQAQTEAAPVIVIDDNATNNDRFLGVNDFSIGFGRSTTFDSLPLHVRENLRPHEAFGPTSPVGCSPSVPDC